MERIERNGLVFYKHSSWSDIRHGIFTRHGGVSNAHFASLNVGGVNGDDAGAVFTNHQRMYEALDVNADRAVTTWLVHSVDTVIVDGPVKGRTWMAKADGMVTNVTDTPLVMRFADCVPLLAYDPKARVIGLAHAGWRGTVNGMGSSLISVMKARYDCQAEDIEVVIGPSISQKNYQVGEEVVDAVIDYYGAEADLIRRDREDGSAYFDLWSANRLDFERQGVTNIEVMGICTYDHIDDFFSHRGENGKTGRFGVVMSL